MRLFEDLVELVYDLDGTTDPDATTTLLRIDRWKSVVSRDVLRVFWVCTSG
jgi:hypothetical protein